jgi:hypothetical protein
MRKKFFLIAMIVAAGLVFVVVPRTTSSADAASGDCYSGETGPDTPTICE